jgi:hypothetical protein
MQVRDHIVYFDFAVLLWRFDPLALQGHLTNRKVDEFLGTLLREFAPRTQQLLKVHWIYRFFADDRCCRACLRLVFPLSCCHKHWICLYGKSKQRLRVRWRPDVLRQAGLVRAVPLDSHTIVTE